MLWCCQKLLFSGFEPQKDWLSAGQITLIVGIVGAFVVFLGLLAASF